MDLEQSEGGAAHEDAARGCADASDCRDWGAEGAGSPDGERSGGGGAESSEAADENQRQQIDLGWLAREVLQFSQDAGNGEGGGRGIYKQTARLGEVSQTSLWIDAISFMHVLED